MLARLEGLLLDADAGVLRSRAATVLGEFASPCSDASVGLALGGEDGRVQEKAWAAFVEILVRSGSLPLLQEWDRTLAQARQGPRRLQLLGEAAGRWQKQPDLKDVAGPAQEMLIAACLEQRKWGSACAALRELLARPAGEAETDRLHWLLTAGEQALREGNRAEALRGEGRPAPPAAVRPPGEGFDKLEKAAEQE